MCDIHISPTKYVRYISTLFSSLQVSDVESEVNGFFTYDRVLKINDAEARSIAAAHADLIAAAS